jgi:MFS family permease
MRFQTINNYGGWIAFAIALVTYWLTFEETASYWDCGEFIAVAYKLEVSHPPGAPLYMLLGRMFSFLAFGDVTKVSYWINSLSVLASAFTILFLFWSITLFSRKLLGIKRDEEMSAGQIWMVMGAALVGSLAYTFSDSFWFSAVEAEVYAMSAFFTAFVVWGILKWDVMEDEAAANRWLIFIAYVMGLSIGVHMLNLVTIPALGLIYYFKKYQPTRWGIIAALAVSGGIVIFINDFIVPGLPSLAGGFELFFVNNLGLPFGSGVVVFILLLIGGLVYGIRYSHAKNKPLLNTFLLSTAFILIGYGSYATIVIRSNFDTPINENAPKDVMSFVRYLKREQYGSRPLLYGPYFTAKIIDLEEKAAVYTKGKDKYEITDRKYDYVYEPGQQTILPRAWNPEFKQQYRNILGLREGERPTFAQNIYYMFRQQIGHMYMRYFMWNFAGRASDIQDADWVGPRDWFEKLPQELSENRARNNFFMIPFVLGLIGMFYQFIKDTKNFAVVGLLFVMTGVAIVVYLNSPPVEPRERDYIYSGSTYAFTFWIGFAVIGIATFIDKFIKNLKTSTVVATALALTAPFLMASQGWDDHNRGDRFFSVDSGKNYLSSCEPNAILYTGGDNDTFMLWYAQEVEEHRPDVRVVVFSYYNTDWYIEQSMLKQNQSEPFKYTLTKENYRQGGPNDVLYFSDLKIPSMDLRQYLDLLKKNFPQLRYDRTNIVPSKVFTLNVDRADVLAKGIIPKGMDSLVVDQMRIRLKGNSLEKKDLAFLDVLATANWERPIYLNNTSLAQLNLEIRDYVVQEGNAYRVLPVRNNRRDRENLVDVESSYKKMLKDFGYRGLDNPKLYYNEDYRGFIQNHRGSLNSLAEALLDQGDKDRGKEVLYFNLERMPDAAVRYDITTVSTVELLFRAGETAKAAEIANVLGTRAEEMVTYEIRKYTGISMEVRRNLYILGELQRILYENGNQELGKKFEDAYNRILENLQIRDTDRDAF